MEEVIERNVALLLMRPTTDSYGSSQMSFHSAYDDKDSTEIDTINLDLR